MEPELKELLRLLFRRAWFMVLMAAVFGGSVFYYHDKYAVPSYEAVSKVIVHTSSTSEYTDTYKEILTTPVIMDPAAARHPELGLTSEQLASRISVGTSEKSQVMSISVRDPSPDKAAAIVHAVADTFREEIPKVMKVDSVTILSDSGKAEPPRNVSKSLTSKLAIAVVLSFMASIGLILLREYFDDKIRTEKDVAVMLGKPLLATVTRIRKGDFKTGEVEDLELSKKIKAGEAINVGVNQ
ncbi:YveK family protein [Cohnella candidum]|uniref:Lipopolysaccharide biosynthesis protein n=1 Tax=Cohnella candidum TaxID=2674991 RepID=A0A3G3K0Y7_9BACL|nr:hypothetical protein [Cohnella candidum]AYQ73821.1 hypothetical protein EAV92_15290 [Cohnella candidum]